VDILISERLNPICGRAFNRISEKRGPSFHTRFEFVREAIDISCAQLLQARMGESNVHPPGRQFGLLITASERLEGIVEFDDLLARRNLIRDVLDPLTPQTRAVKCEKEKILVILKKTSKDISLYLVERKADISWDIAATCRSRLGVRICHLRYSFGSIG
jgi:hypothetical protein